MKILLQATWLRIFLVVLVLLLPITGIYLYADHVQKNSGQVKAAQIKAFRIPTPTSTIAPTPTIQQNIQSTDIYTAPQLKEANNPTPTNAPTTTTVQNNTYIYIQPTSTPVTVSNNNVLAPTSVPTPTTFYSQQVEDALSQLTQTLTNIEKEPIAMNIIDGRRQSAYQSWVGNNQQVYSIIQSTTYKGRLNAILEAHGLGYDTIE